ncbi:CsbD family protein [Hoyosella sp. G463]|uniref:CsbD family protein n=1 Tax=Lolliginicoccus lacisalsi TaxID=2742202 RepID=A0A927JA54_9ACTN|nr:CsbD family protein [Lolliginicoccus lacisalsi]MBD8505336.1 CsbD family protein [Lolliginicoccus lacisalsi]
MGLGDKISNKAQELKGKTKETAGSATSDEELKAEGQADQAESGVKKGVENVKDKANEATKKVTGD